MFEHADLESTSIDADSSLVLLQKTASTFSSHFGPFYFVLKPKLLKVLKHVTVRTDVQITRNRFNAEGGVRMMATN